MLSELLTDAAGVPGAAGQAGSGVAMSGSKSQVIPPALTDDDDDDDDEYPALWV